MLYSFRAFGMPSQMGLEAIYVFFVDFLDVFSPGVCSALQSFAWWESSRGFAFRILHVKVVESSLVPCLDLAVVGILIA